VAHTSAGMAPAMASVRGETNAAPSVARSAGRPGTGPEHHTGCRRATFVITVDPCPPPLLVVDRASRAQPVALSTVKKVVAGMPRGLCGAERRCGAKEAAYVPSGRPVGFESARVRGEPECGEGKTRNSKVVREALVGVIRVIARAPLR
jgi:hypothetical protein